LLFSGPLLLASCKNLRGDDARGSVAKSEPRSGTKSLRRGANQRAQGAKPEAAVVAKVAKTTMAFPTGDPATSALMLHKQAPAQVAVEVPFDVVLEVENISSLALEGVVLTESLPEGYTLLQAEPAATAVQGSVARWNLGAVRPGESRIVKVTGKATKTGDLIGCSNVAYTSSLCSTVHVVAPDLGVVRSAPVDQLLCDPIELRYTVTNPGTGAATDVIVHEELPEGWSTMDDQRSVSVRIGDVLGGGSEEHTVRVKATQAGTFTGQATAASTNGLKVTSAESATILRRPKLEVFASAPASVFAGKPVRIMYGIKNSGDGPAASVQLVQPLPEGAKLLGEIEGGSVTSGKLTVELGTIEAGTTRNAEVTLACTTMGTVTCLAEVQAVCAVPVATSTRFEVTGIPALLLELEDEEDPTEIGKEMTYLIKITNQGSAPDQDLRVVCMLEQGVEYVGVSGDAKATAEGQKIVFDAIPTLAPGAVATLRVKVKGLVEADSRFGISLTSKEKERPIIESEATTFYK